MSHSTEHVRSKATTLKALFIAAVLCSGFATGVLWAHTVTNASDKAAEEQQQKYDLLARRVLIEQPNDVLIDFRMLQTQLERYIAVNKLEQSVSLNFEYLPTGSSIGINENKEQVGASLLKLPLTMSVYKAAEQKKINLDTPVALKQEWLNSSFGDLYKKGAGYKLTTRQAAQEALGSSDNTAALLLFDAVTKAQGTSSPNLLGFIDANYGETQNHEVLIDSRSYSSILKCLYFACFLNKDNSQEVLNYLAKADATNRLVAKLPEDIKVAHKIGTFNTETQSDCGIFYLPKRNYVLCIMVDGKDPEASATIANLSSIVFEYLSKVN